MKKAFGILMFLLIVIGMPLNICLGILGVSLAKFVPGETSLETSIRHGWRCGIATLVLISLPIYFW